MSDVWKKSYFVPIYKNKGVVQECGIYRGIRLMSHTMKVGESYREKVKKNTI